MLTRGQHRTLNFIKQFMSQNDYAPTAAEIAAGTGIKSRGVVHRYLRALESAGALALEPKRHRNIILKDQFVIGHKKPHLPLVGQIAAGEPIEALQDADSINLAEIFLGENRYALRVKGNSMIDEGIFDGDIVICEQSDTAQNGQIVVALVDRQEATLKRFQRGPNNEVILHPANQAMNPMIYPQNRVAIQGIYVGLLRTT